MNNRHKLSCKIVTTTMSKVERDTLADTVSASKTLTVPRISFDGGVNAMSVYKASNAWTPTLVGITNLSPEPTLVRGDYVQIGKLVTFSFTATVDPAVTATLTQFTFVLPVPLTTVTGARMGTAGVGTEVATVANVTDYTETTGIVAWTASGVASVLILVQGSYVLN